MDMVVMDRSLVRGRHAVGWNGAECGVWRNGNPRRSGDVLLFWGPICEFWWGPSLLSLSLTARCWEKENCQKSPPKQKNQGLAELCLKPFPGQPWVDLDICTKLTCSSTLSPVINRTYCGR